ncbi:acyltransferase [Desulfobacula toluolica]|uniref:acyltransferase n=1 Tax=Desulfobacula toluolica TaxID=28223 RepID=UPI001E540F05|nr:hypothetical protein [Desulfobacula toluolica]
MNIIRIFLYNNIMGYSISYSSKIGIGSIIAVRTARINESCLGSFNRFIGGFDLIIGKKSDIGSFNEFVCTSSSAGKAFCTIGKNVHITKCHFFDASGGLTIKDHTRIAGRGSQFWTHGGQREKTEIVINEKCYVGSAVRMTQGVEIAQNSYVGLGSVVVDSFKSPDILIFGHPAKNIKNDIIARKSLVP